MRSRGRILESVYGAVNINFCSKSNLRAIAQIRSFLKEVTINADVKFAMKFTITLRHGGNKQHLRRLISMITSQVLTKCSINIFFINITSIYL